MSAKTPGPAGALCLRNRQRRRAVDLRLLRRLARHLLEEHFRPERFVLAVHLVSAPEITRLNARFLGHAGPTDVVTLDYAGPAAPPRALGGEVFICLDEAVAQARRFRTTWQQELARYLVHGLLHLSGYDDQTPAARRRMKRAEDRLLRRLAARFPLRRLARRSGPAPRQARTAQLGFEIPSLKLRWTPAPPA